jgi:S1-C subfamily serine protease
MKRLYLSNYRISFKWSFKSFLLVIFGTLLTTWFLVGCRQKDMDKPFSYMNLRQVGDYARPATVYIEVIERNKTENALPSFVSDPFFRSDFDVDMLESKINGELAGRGTGMIIDAQGHILTNNHVVSGATMIEVMLATGRWCPAKLIGSDPETDLAVIRIYDQITLPHVIFGDSDILAEGEPVVTIEYARRTRGNSKPALSPTVFGGIIKAAQPHGITYCSICPDYFTTDVGNNWGNSGAILLNRQGEVVGVDVAIVTQSNETGSIGFAIPSNTAVNIVEKMISHGLKGS